MIVHIDNEVFQGIKKTLAYYAEKEVINEDGTQSELDSDYIQIEGDNKVKFKFKTGKAARLCLEQIERYFKETTNE